MEKEKNCSSSYVDIVEIGARGSVWWGSAANYCFMNDGVRPVIHLNLEDTAVWSYAGTVCSDGTSVEENYPIDETFNGSTFQLSSSSGYLITTSGELTGIKLNKNSARDVVKWFSAPNLVCKDVSGKVLSDTDLLGTGSTISIMDGDEVKAQCTVY